MNRFFKTVLLTGLLVGTTDLVSAFIMGWAKTGMFPAHLLNYIAGGVLGLETAMQGGDGAALLGLVLHYLISFAFTLLFFWVFPRLKFLHFNKYLAGMLYAVFVNLCVEQLVRLSPLPPRHFSIAYLYISWVILGVLFGIPVAYNAYKYYGIADNKAN